MQKAHSRILGVFLKTPNKKLKELVGEDFHQKPLANLAREKVAFLEGSNKKP